VEGLQQTTHDDTAFALHAWVRLRFCLLCHHHQRLSQWDVVERVKTDPHVSAELLTGAAVDAGND